MKLIDFFREKKRSPASLDEVFYRFQRSKKSGDYRGNLGYRDICIFPLVGASDLFVYREGLIAHALEMRGARVTIVLCDGFLPACDARTFSNDLSCDHCHQNGRLKYESFGLNVVGLGQFLNEKAYEQVHRLSEGISNDQIFQFELDGVQIGKLVFSSLNRYYLAAGIDIKDSVVSQKLREYFVSALRVYYAVKGLLKEAPPDKVFMSHGIYITWGTIFQAMSQAGIPVDTYAASYRRNTLRVYHNTPVAPIPEAEWRSFRHLKLTFTQKEKVKEYLQSRITQSEDFMQLQTSVDEDIDRIEQALGMRPGEKVPILFTNIAWDGMIFSDNAVFDGMFEWLDTTLDYFIANPDRKVIIKAHPAEVKGAQVTPDEWRVQTHIEKKYGTLPENILLLLPEDKISTFKLYEIASFGIIHISTVGLEMALKGIPVLSSGGRGQYSGHGFILDPESKEEYLQYLDDLVSGRSDFRGDIEMAQRFLYYRFFREAIPFDYYDLNVWTIREFRIQGPADLLPGKSRGLDILCEGILNDGEFLWESGKE